MTGAGTAAPTKPTPGTRWTLTRPTSRRWCANWWRQGMMGGAKAHYDCIAAFSETDFTGDLKAVSLPVLLMHGEDDQVVPIEASARKAIELLPNGTLKTL